MKKSILLSLFSGALLFMANNSAVGMEYEPPLEVKLPTNTKIVTDKIHSFNENKTSEKGKTSTKSKDKYKKHENMEKEIDEVFADLIASIRAARELGTLTPERRMLINALTAVVQDEKIEDD